MPEHKTHIFNVGDGNFIVKIADEDMVILDAGANGGGKGEKVGWNDSVFRDLLGGIKNVHTIISHPHKDHISLLKKVLSNIKAKNGDRKQGADKIEVASIYAGGTRPRELSSRNGHQDLAQILPEAAKDLNKPITVHVWERGEPKGDDAIVQRRQYSFYPSSYPSSDTTHLSNEYPLSDTFGTTGSPSNVSSRDLSFKVGGKLTGNFNDMEMATVGGETFWKGSSSIPSEKGKKRLGDKTGFGDEISLGKEKISILTPKAFVSLGDNDSVNGRSLIAVSQFRGVKQVFPGDASSKEIGYRKDSNTLKELTDVIGSGGVAHQYPNAIPGADFFIPPHHNSTTDDQASVFRRLATSAGNAKSPKALSIISTKREEGAHDFESENIKENIGSGGRPILPVSTQSANLSFADRFIVTTQEDGKLELERTFAGPPDSVSLVGKFTSDALGEIMQKARYSKKTGAITAAFSPERVRDLLRNPALRPEKDTWIPNGTLPNGTRVSDEAGKVVNSFEREREKIFADMRGILPPGISDTDLAKIKLESTHQVSYKPKEGRALPSWNSSKLSAPLQENLYRVIRRNQRGMLFEEDNLKSLHKKLTNAGVIQTTYEFENFKSNCKFEDFELSKTITLNVPNSLRGMVTDTSELAGQLAFQAKELSREKKKHTGRMLNLANPLVDPYITRAVKPPTVKKEFSVFSPPITLSYRRYEKQNTKRRRDRYGSSNHKGKHPTRWECSRNGF